MITLSQVSRTALSTLISRAVEAERKNMAFHSWRRCFGLDDARQIETYAQGLKVIGARQGGLGLGPMVAISIHVD